MIRTAKNVADRKLSDKVDASKSRLRPPSIKQSLTPKQEKFKRERSATGWFRIKQQKLKKMVNT